MYALSRQLGYHCSGIYGLDKNANSYRGCKTHRCKRLDTAGPHLTCTGRWIDRNPGRCRAHNVGRYHDLENKAGASLALKSRRRIGMSFLRR